jgi:hypothetical protein
MVQNKKIFLIVRLTKDQKDEIKTSAKRSGLRISEYARRVLIGTPSRLDKLEKQFEKMHEEKRKAKGS